MQKKLDIFIKRCIFYHDLLKPILCFKFWLHPNVRLQQNTLHLNLSKIHSVEQPIATIYVTDAIYHMSGQF